MGKPYHKQRIHPPQYNNLEQDVIEWALDEKKPAGGASDPRGVGQQPGKEKQDDCRTSVILVSRQDMSA